MRLVLYVHTLSHIDVKYVIINYTISISMSSFSLDIPDRGSASPKDNLIGSSSVRLSHSPEDNLIGSSSFRLSDSPEDNLIGSFSASSTKSSVNVGDLSQKMIEASIIAITKTKPPSQSASISGTNGFGNIFGNLFNLPFMVRGQVKMGIESKQNTIPVSQIDVLEVNATPKYDGKTRRPIDIEVVETVNNVPNFTELIDKANKKIQELTEQIENADNATAKAINELPGEESKNDMLVSNVSHSVTL